MSRRHYWGSKANSTSGSRGIWMRRLKYSMSEALLKKFLRLGAGGQKAKQVLMWGSKHPP